VQISTAMLNKRSTEALEGKAVLITLQNILKSFDSALEYSCSLSS